MDRRDFLRYTAASTAGLYLGSNVGCSRLVGGAGAAHGSLAADWRFQLDRDDVGVAREWFTQALAERIELPGSLQEQGHGDEISVDTEWTGTLYDQAWHTRPEYQPYTEPGNIMLPFWLQPERHYVGVAWSQREIEIPAGWEGRRTVLFLERPHWDHRLVGWHGRGVQRQPLNAPRLRSGDRAGPRRPPPDHPDRQPGPRREPLQEVAHDLGGEVLLRPLCSLRARCLPRLRRAPSHPGSRPTSRCRHSSIEASPYRASSGAPFCSQA